MKKIAVLAVLILMAGAAAFALPEFKMSFGGGGILDMTFGNGIKSDTPEMKSTTTSVGAGAFVFFDATFVEADFAFVGGGTRSKMSGSGSSISMNGTFSALDLSLLGKYPFSLGRITVFPLLGFDYQIVVSAKDSGGTKVDEPGDASSFGFDFGGGLDFPLTDHLFLRGELLYAIRLPSKTLKDAKDANPDSKYILGNGPTIKIAVGYSL